MSVEVPGTSTFTPTIYVPSNTTILDENALVDMQRGLVNRTLYLHDKLQGIPYYRDHITSGRAYCVPGHTDLPFAISSPQFLSGDFYEADLRFTVYKRPIPFTDNSTPPTGADVRFGGVGSSTVLGQSRYQIETPRVGSTTGQGAKITPAILEPINGVSYYGTSGSIRCWGHLQTNETTRNGRIAVVMWGSESYDGYIEWAMQINVYHV